MEAMKDIKINDVEGFVFSSEPRPIVVEDGRVLNGKLIEAMDDLVSIASTVDELEASLKQNIAPVVYASEYEESINAARDNISVIHNRLSDLVLYIQRRSITSIIK